MSILRELRAQVQELLTNLDAIDAFVQGMELHTLQEAMAALAPHEEIRITVGRDYEGKYKAEFKGWTGSTFTEDFISLADCMRALKRTPPAPVEPDTFVASLIGAAK